MSDPGPGITPAWNAPSGIDADPLATGDHVTLRTHLLNQLLRIFVKRRLRGIALDQAAIEQARVDIETYVARRSRRSLPADVQIAAGDLGGRPAEIVTPRGARAIRQPRILYLHGGAFILCSPQTHRPITTRLASVSGAIVATPDYRLAPEHPFPAALEDAVASYCQLLDSGPDGDADGRRRGADIVIAGDSAGGGLVLALLQSLRSRGLPMPAGAICFSPWTDLTCSGPSMHNNVKTEAMLPRERIADAVALYTGGCDAADCLVSPVFGSFAGFPPLLLHVGSGEILLDDTCRVATRASAAGVDVQCRIWQGQPHVFQMFAPHLPEATLAMDEAGRFVRRVTRRA